MGTRLVAGERAVVGQGVDAGVHIRLIPCGRETAAAAVVADEVVAAGGEVAIGVGAVAAVYAVFSHQRIAHCEGHSGFGIETAAVDAGVVLRHCHIEEGSGAVQKRNAAAVTAGGPVAADSCVDQCDGRAGCDEEAAAAHSGVVFRNQRMGDCQGRFGVDAAAVADSLAVAVAVAHHLAAFHQQVAVGVDAAAVVRRAVVVDGAADNPGECVVVVQTAAVIRGLVVFQRAVGDGQGGFGRDGPAVVAGRVVTEAAAHNRHFAVAYIQPAAVVAGVIVAEEAIVNGRFAFVYKQPTAISACVVFHRAVGDGEQAGGFDAAADGECCVAQNLAFGNRHYTFATATDLQIDAAAVFLGIVFADDDLPEMRRSTAVKTARQKFGGIGVEGRVAHLQQSILIEDAAAVGGGKVVANLGAVGDDQCAGHQTARSDVQNAAAAVQPIVEFDNAIGNVKQAPQIHQPAAANSFVVLKQGITCHGESRAGIGAGAANPATRLSAVVGEVHAIDQHVALQVEETAAAIRGRIGVDLGIGDGCVGANRIDAAPVLIRQAVENPQIFHCRQGIGDDDHPPAGVRVQRCRVGVRVAGQPVGDCIAAAQGQRFVDVGRLIHPRPALHAQTVARYPHFAPRGRAVHRLLHRICIQATVDCAADVGRGKAEADRVGGRGAVVALVIVRIGGGDDRAVLNRRPQQCHTLAETCGDSENGAGVGEHSFHLPGVGRAAGLGDEQTAADDRSHRQADRDVIGDDNPLHRPVPGIGKVQGIGDGPTGRGDGGQGGFADGQLHPCHGKGSAALVVARVAVVDGADQPGVVNRRSYRACPVGHNAGHSQIARRAHSYAGQIPLVGGCPRLHKGQPAADDPRHADLRGEVVGNNDAQGRVDCATGGDDKGVGNCPSRCRHRGVDALGKPHIGGLHLQRAHITAFREEVRPVKVPLVVPQRRAAVVRTPKQKAARIEGPAPVESRGADE